MNLVSFFVGVVAGVAIPAVVVKAIEYKSWFHLYRKNVNNTWYQAAGKALEEVDLF
jgi:hypothetical protein